MRRIVLLLMLLAITFCVGDAAMMKEEKLNLVPDPEWLPLEQWESGDKNYKENKALNAMLNLAMLADWYLTDKGIQNNVWDNGYKELNPILGPRPNRTELGAYHLSILLGNYLLPKIIGPEYTDILRSYLFAAEIPAIDAWLNPTYTWKAPPWQITIPFKF